MNFKILFLLLFISACGVKGDPIAPRSPVTPSLLDNYPDIDVEKSIQEQKRR